MEKWNTHKCFFSYRKKYTLEGENPPPRPLVQKVSLKNTEFLPCTNHRRMREQRLLEWIVWTCWLPYIVALL